MTEESEKDFPSREGYVNYLVQQIIGYKKEIADLESRVIKWIPVTERLPENGEVLCSMREGYVTKASYYDGEWFDIYGSPFDENPITHWSSLPAGPEEGKDA